MSGTSHIPILYLFNQFSHHSFHEKLFSGASHFSQGTGFAVPVTPVSSIAAVAAVLVVVAAVAAPALAAVAASRILGDRARHDMNLGTLP